MVTFPYNVKQAGRQAGIDHEIKRKGMISIHSFELSTLGIFGVVKSTPITGPQSA